MFKEILKLLTKNGKKSLLISSLFFALYSLCSIVMLVIVFSTFFKILSGKDMISLYKNFIFISILVIFKGICNMIADLEKHNAGFDIVQKIRELMIIKLKKFSLSFYTNERLGEINTILHKDVDNMSLVVGHMWSRMFGEFLVAFVVFFGLIMFNIKLALVMVISIPIALGFLYFTIKKSKKIENKNNSVLLDMVSLFVEYVRGIPVLKSFSNNKSLDKKLTEKIEKFGETSKITSKFKAKQLAIFAFLLDIGYFILLIFGTIFVLKGELNIFSFIIFSIVSKEFYKPFASMETHYMYYISAVDSYERLGKILYANTIPDRSNGLSPKKNNISFENIFFYYEKDNFKIEDLSFDIKENSITALVGESGSGKTTITNLLLRFYDVNQGSIKLGNIDIRDIPYDELLNRISIVMQNVQLFNNTIEENLRVGKKDANKEEIIEACKKSKIHDFIMSLPEQYETHIGENGGLLSGGQRQRISIARAFLKNAPILILDEMTSNVDPINESLIQEAITELAKDRTVLVIAHHLNTIQHADQILVFQKGKLLEKGKHQELLQKEGYYKKLWQAQDRA
ncbi:MULTISPECIES: ABC transporter ATP-binding protein [Fusobacterium]|uniref:ABC transporter ATP-binding protein n=1 Tax=Fusobacterium nucleatum TaxID=851 RepID=A0AAX3MBC4_FUSNU|nr:ABC transporter ATP-binding protein [Fusobacterium nucleatum]WDA43551.1 ABC transporter ATP-binding protein [Fusobacterium nucleatum]